MLLKNKSAKKKKKKSGNPRPFKKATLSSTDHNYP